MCSVCCCAAGCRTQTFSPHVLNVAHREPLSVTAQKIDTHALDQHLLEVLAEELSADAWQPNREWTPLDIWQKQILGEEPLADFRWRFHHLAAQQQLHDLEVAVANKPALEAAAAPTESVTPTNDVPDSVETETTSQPPATWNGYWPMSVLRTLDQSTPIIADNQSQQESAAIRYLLHLSQRRDRVGWNAAILLGQRTPSTSGHLAPLLEKIVRGDVKSSTVRGQSSDGEESSASKDVPTSNEEKKKVTAPVAIETATKLEERISESMRCAAAEAWCLVLMMQHDRKARDAVETLAPAGLLLEDPALDLAIRGELYCQLSRWIAPRQIPRLANALQASGDSLRAPVEIRRAAILACLNHAVWHRQTGLNSSNPVEVPESPYPETIGNCRYDPDVAVRRHFLQWISVSTEDAPSRETVKTMTRDTDLIVQREAIVALGRFPSQLAVDELHKFLARKEEPIRESAIRGLCQRHASETTRYLHDESAVVRRGLAQALGALPTAETVPLLEQLIVDRDPSVQLAAAASCRSRPDCWRIPILYTGLLDGYLATRQHCFDQLLERTGAVGVIPLEGTRDDRRIAADEFLAQHRLLSYVHTAHALRSVREHSPNADAALLKKHDVAQKWESIRNRQPGIDLTADEIRALFSENDRPTLEQLLDTAPEAQKSLLIGVVLPAISAEYQSLLEMQDPSVDKRRTGADRLAQWGGERQSLSPQVVRILRERLLYEQDRIVWQRAMAAIFPDGTDEAAEIALVALNHQWPDIRLLGCRFIVRHPHPSRGIWLLPLLNDVNPAVMQTAIEGAGLCHNPVVLDGLPDTELTTVDAVPSPATEPQSTPAHSHGLRPLLGHAQMPVREAAAVAMCRLGDRQAMQQLQQWSLDANPQIREQAVAAMGESHQGRFIEQLIRLGWTEPNTGVQQAILRSLCELVPEEQRPRGLSPTQPAGEAFKVWMEWWKVRSTPDTTAVYPSGNLQSN